MSTRLRASLQALSYQFIGLRRFCDTARVRVGEDDGRGLFSQGFLDDLARVNGRPIDRALEHLPVANQSMAPVEEDHREDFPLECS